MRQSLLKKKNPKTVKEKQIQVAIDSTKNYDTLFGKGTAKELLINIEKMVCHQSLLPVLRFEC